MGIPAVAVYLVAAIRTVAISAASTTSADFSTFLDFATSVLTWFLTSFTSIVTWMLANPIAFWGLVVGIIGTVFVYLRSTIGG